MCGFPNDFDDSIFVGREVEYVSYTANSIFLGFGNNISLTIESSYECRLIGDEEHFEMQRPPVAYSRLMQLLGQKVVSVMTEQQGTLTLGTEKGSLLRIFVSVR